MGSDDQQRDYEPKGETDWVEVLVAVAGALGFNKVRLRWKLQIWRNKLTKKARGADNSRRHIAYEHQVCSECGQLNDQREQACTACGQSLSSRKMVVLHRIGLSLPTALSVSTALGVAMVLIHARLIVSEMPDAGLLSLKVETLYRFGGHWPPAVLAGQWWRWLTPIFLHAGLMHIGFNLFALSQIGPAVEQIFGRGRMLALFMVTGVLANIVSFVWGLDGVGIGASGAIMGLCGLAGGWGHREGTTVSLQIRNMMGKWGVYTIVFGFFIGADNAAHAGGFVSGAVVGYLLQPSIQRRSRRVWLEVLQSLVGSAMALASIALCLFPPAVPEDAFTSQQAPQNPYSYTVGICRLHEQGHTDQALARLQAGNKADEIAPAAGRAMIKQTCGQIRQHVVRCKRLLASPAAAAAEAPAADSGASRPDADQELKERASCRWLLRAQQEQ